MLLEKFTHYGNQEEKGKPITIHYQTSKVLFSHAFPIKNQISNARLNLCRITRTQNIGCQHKCHRTASFPQKEATERRTPIDSKPSIRSKLRFISNKQILIPLSNTQKKKKKEQTIHIKIAYKKY